MRWRTDKMCSDCPFATTGKGRKLRGSLRPKRWRSILAGLRRDESFPCHQTIEYDEDGDYKQGTGLLCAGALAWQEKHCGQPSQLARIMQRLAARRDMTRILSLTACLALGAYAVYCGLHMKAFIGTGHYWSNVWFYKSHACLFAMIILRLLAAREG